LESLSDRIKQLRKVLKLSQKEFGGALGTTRDVIGNLEYGRSIPKAPFLDLICIIFNVNSDWLIKGTGDMFKPVPQSNEELEEAARIFNKLSPALQKYALQQIKGLLEVQNNDDKPNNQE
jgi:transcriptional regulator with XRE-family HTH domain